MFKNVMNYRNLRVMHVSVIYRHESYLYIILIHYTTHVFARKQCILCYALRRKSYPILPYVTSLRVSFSFCLGTSAHGFIMLPPRSLASSWGCSLAIIEIDHSTQVGTVIVFMSGQVQTLLFEMDLLADFFWSETLLGVNLLLARLSVRGYLCVSTRQQIFINFITPDDNRMIFTLRNYTG